MTGRENECAAGKGGLVEIRQPVSTSTRGSQPSHEERVSPSRVEGRVSGMPTGGRPPEGDRVPVAPLSRTSGVANFLTSS